MTDTNHPFNASFSESQQAQLAEFSKGLTVDPRDAVKRAIQYLELIHSLHDREDADDEAIDNDIRKMRDAFYQLMLGRLEAIENEAVFEEKKNDVRTLMYAFKELHQSYGADFAFEENVRYANLFLNIADAYQLESGYYNIALVSFILPNIDNNLDLTFGKKQNTALHYAVSHHLNKMAQTFIVRGARYDIPNAEGETAVDLADVSQKALFTEVAPAVSHPVGSTKVSLDEPHAHLLKEKNLVISVGNNQVILPMSDVRNVQFLGGGAYGDVVRFRYVGDNEVIKRHYPADQTPDGELQHWLVDKLPKSDSPDAWEAFINNEQTSPAELSVPYLENPESCPYNFALPAFGESGRPMLVGKCEIAGWKKINGEWVPEALTLKDFCDTKVPAVGDVALSAPADQTSANYKQELDLYTRYKAMTDNLDLTYVSLFVSLYQSIRAIHAQNKLHLDVAARNALLRPVIKPINGIDVTVGYSAIACDFGMTLNYQPPGVYENRDTGPLRWMSKDRLLRQAIMPNADVVGAQVVFLEMNAGPIKNVDLELIQGAGLDLNQVARNYIEDGHENTFKKYLSHVNDFSKGEKQETQIAQFVNWFTAFETKDFGTAEEADVMLQKLLPTIFLESMQKQLQLYKENNNALDLIIAMNVLQSLPMLDADMKQSDLYVLSKQIAEADSNAFHLPGNVDEYIADIGRILKSKEVPEKSSAEVEVVRREEKVALKPEVETLRAAEMAALKIELYAYEELKKRVMKKGDEMMFARLLNTFSHIKESADKLEADGVKIQHLFPEISKNTKAFNAAAAINAIRDDHSELFQIETNIVAVHHNLSHIFESFKAGKSEIFSPMGESLEHPAIVFFRNVKAVPTFDEHHSEEDNAETVFNLINKKEKLLSDKKLNNANQFIKHLSSRSIETIADRLIKVDTIIDEVETAITKHTKTLEYLIMLNETFRDAKNHLGTPVTPIQILAIAELQRENTGSTENFVRALTPVIDKKNKHAIEEQRQIIAELMLRKDQLNAIKTILSQARNEKSQEIAAKENAPFVELQTISSYKKEEIPVTEEEQLHRVFEKQLQELEDYAKPRRFDNKLERKHRQIVRTALFNLQNMHHDMNEVDENAQLTQQALQRRLNYLNQIIEKNSALHTYTKGHSSPIQKLRELKETTATLLVLHNQHAHIAPIKPELQFDAKPPKSQLRQVLASTKKYIAQYLKVGEKMGGRNKPGAYGGVYTVNYQVRDKTFTQALLFKQDTKGTTIRHHKNIAEVVSSRIMNALTRESNAAASVFFAVSPNIKPHEKFTPNDVYVGSIYFDRYADLFEVLGFEERPRAVGSLNKKRFLRGFLKRDAKGALLLDEHHRAQCAFGNLKLIVPSALTAADFDLHSGNLGVVYDPVEISKLNDAAITAAVLDNARHDIKLFFTEEIAADANYLKTLIADLFNNNWGNHAEAVIKFLAQALQLNLRTPITTEDMVKQIRFALLRLGVVEGKLVKIDHGGALKNLAPDLNWHSRLKHKFGFEPTNHIRELPRDLKITAEFAQELDAEASVDLTSTIENVMNEVAEFYDAKEVMDFAKHMDFDIKKQLSRKAPDANNPEDVQLFKQEVVDKTKTFLYERLAQRQEKLKELSLEIKLSLCFKKDDNNQFSFESFYMKNDQAHASEINFEALVAENPLYFLNAQYHFRSKDQRRDHKMLSRKTNEALVKHFSRITDAIAEESVKNNSLDTLYLLLKHPAFKNDHEKILATLFKTMQHNTDFSLLITNQLNDLLEHNPSQFLKHDADLTAIYINAAIALSDDAEASAFKPIETLFVQLTKHPKILKAYQDKYTNENLDVLIESYQRNITQVADELNSISQQLFGATAIHNVIGNTNAKMPDAISHAKINLHARMTNEFADTRSVEERVQISERWISVMADLFMKQDYQMVFMIYRELQSVPFASLRRDYPNLFSQNSLETLKAIERAIDDKNILFHSIETSVKKHANVVPPFEYFVDRYSDKSKIKEPAASALIDFFALQNTFNHPGNKKSSFVHFDFDTMTSGKMQTVANIVSVPAKASHPVRVKEAVTENQLKSVQSYVDVILTPQVPLEMQKRRSTEAYHPTLFLHAKPHSTRTPFQAMPTKGQVGNEMLSGLSALEDALKELVKNREEIEKEQDKKSELNPLQEKGNQP